MNTRKVLRILIPSVLIVIATLYILSILPKIEFSILLDISLHTWLLVICLFIIVQLLNIWYFQLILTRMCNINSLPKLFQVLFASHSFNYAGPLKLGMPVRVFLFKRILGVPYTAGIATVMATTGLDVVIIITLVVSLSAWIFISPLVGLVLGLALTTILPGLAAISKKLPFFRPDRPAWLANFFADIMNLSPFAIFLAVLISATKFLLNSAAGWIVLKGFGTTTGLAEFSLVYFSSHLAGLLSLIPMGIGIKDASVIELLGRMGTSPSVGIAFVAIDRLIWSVLPLVIGLMAGWHLGVNELIKSVRSESEPDKVGIQ